MSRLLPDINQKIQLTAAKLQAVHGMAPERAEAKAKGTVAGKFAVGVGLVLCLAAVGLAVLVVLQKAEITLPVVFAVGIIGFVGFSLFGIGMSLISRDAAPLVGGVGELLVKLIIAWRGK